MQMTRSLFALIALAAAFALAPSAASAQNADFDCDVEEQQMRIKYSLYFENYRAENYEAALPDLEWILACSPGFGGRTEDDRNFRRAVEIHEKLAEQATSADERRAHLDQALATIDTAVPRLQQAGVEVDPFDWILRKGRFLQTHQTVYSDRQDDVCAIYEEAYQMRPDELDDFYLQVIAFCRTENALAANTAEGKREARTFLEEALLASADQPAARDYIQTQADRLITTPREQFEYLFTKYEEVGVGGLSDDELEQLFTLNQQAGDQYFETQDEMRTLRRSLLPRVAELNPTYSRIASLGSASLADSDYVQAAAFFEQALELAAEANQRRDTYYNMAVVRQQQNQLASAANFVREALSIDGNHGPSLFMMGSLIQSSIRGSDIDSRAAYWCAADYFSRAASAGVSNAASASASALRGAPTRDEYFFKGWRPGDTVSASYGWGSCQARVR
jgi:tetratricopeptide (TPR) repeat protein